MYIILNFFLLLLLVRTWCMDAQFWEPCILFAFWVIPVYNTSWSSAVTGMISLRSLCKYTHEDELVVALYVQETFQWNLEHIAELRPIHIDEKEIRRQMSQHRYRTLLSRNNRPQEMCAHSFLWLEVDIFTREISPDTIVFYVAVNVISELLLLNHTHAFLFIVFASCFAGVPMCVYDLEAISISVKIRSPFIFLHELNPCKPYTCLWTANNDTCIVCSPDEEAELRAQRAIDYYFQHHMVAPSPWSETPPPHVLPVTPAYGQSKSCASDCHCVVPSERTEG